jgi:pyruvate/2-oxoglutarate dehydrogenase complex dihydrolipoamide dehydrogenase (E3) component
MPGVKYGKITPKGIYLTNQDGKDVFLEADNIILATGSTPNKALGEALKGSTWSSRKSGIVSNRGVSVRPSRKESGPP